MNYHFGYTYMANLCKLVEVFQIVTHNLTEISFLLHKFVWFVDDVQYDEKLILNNILYKYVYKTNLYQL